MAALRVRSGARLELAAFLRRALHGLCTMLSVRQIPWLSHNAKELLLLPTIAFANGAPLSRLRQKKNSVLSEYKNHCPLPPNKKKTIMGKLEIKEGDLLAGEADLFV